MQEWERASLIAQVKSAVRFAKPHLHDDETVVKMGHRMGTA
jgi:hypothetical protein